MGGNVECREAVEEWYNEIKMYNYKKPGFNAKTGHFTQMIWKATTKVGCGCAKKGKSTYMLVNYI